MKFILETVIVATVLCGFQSARADSDGYFCIGPDFMAYQLNMPGFPGAHKLYVIPFDGGQSKIAQYEADLPDFQVHDIRCAAEHVRIVGWDAVYDISWDAYDPSPLSVTATKKESGAPDHGETDPPKSLVYGPDQRISLNDPDSIASYGLETTRKDIPELECTELVTVKLWKHESDLIVDALILVSRDVPKECG